MADRLTEAIDEATRTEGAWRLKVLTPQQRKVLLGLSHGLSQPEIARLLNLSEGTVRSHTKSIRERLLAKNASHSVAVALRAGIIK